MFLIHRDLMGYLINRNMRCIEITVVVLSDGAAAAINRNMRCIEIR